MATQIFNTRKKSHKITYDEFLREGKKGYCDNLCTLQWKSIREDKESIIGHLEKLKAEITEKRGTSIKAFTIGKTHAGKKNKETFDARNFSTWKTDRGIKQRWNDFNKKGYDCLIVLCGFTRNVIPNEDEQTEQQNAIADDQSGKESLLNQHDWALEFESHLIHYYLKENPDPCLDNKSLESGDICDTRTVCGVVYVAIKLNESSWYQQTTLQRVGNRKRHKQRGEEKKWYKQPRRDTSRFSGLQELKTMKELPGTRIDRLIKKGVLPTQQQLEDLQRKFILTGSTEISENLKLIGNLVSKSIKKQYPEVSSSWLAYKPDKEGNPKVLVVLEMPKNTDANFEDIGYEFHVFKAGKFSKEAEKVQKEMSKQDILKLENDHVLMNCIRKHRVALKKRHSQLAIIEPSPIRSKGFQQNKHKFVEEKCIAVYVRRKGYIPIGEVALNTMIDGISVDVLEGIFVLCAAEMGRNIGTESEPLGTLGGFIEHPLHGLCGITAAHVLLSAHEMETLINDGKIAKNYFDTHCIPVHIYRGENDKIKVGDVVEALYTSGDENLPGMEVAIFQLQDEIPTNGIIWNALTEGTEDETFDTGKILKEHIVDVDTRLVKFGATTGKTNGILFRRRGDVFLQPDDDFPGFQLFELIMIAGANGNKFSKKGDSGSLVLAEGNEHYLAVGILGGVKTYGRVIATYVMPIRSVMHAFGISSLKCFTEDQMLISFRRMETTLADVSNTLNDHLQNHNAPENNL